MSGEILVRVLWTVGIIVGGFVLYRLWAFFMLRRRGGKYLGLGTVRPGVPTILYFTTPGCIPCKTVQRPALAQLTSLLNDRLQVIEINAEEQPEIADYWGVLSVPTTFIIDSQGQPRHVNRGVAREDILLRKLREIEGEQFFSESHVQPSHETKLVGCCAPDDVLSFRIESPSTTE